MGKSDFTIGMLVGGALGAALALLYAPAPGEEIRHTLGDKATDLGDTVKGKATEYGSTVKGKATEYGTSIRDAATHLGGTVRDKVASAKDHAADAARDVADSAHDVADTLDKAEVPDPADLKGEGKPGGSNPA